MKKRVIFLVFIAMVLMVMPASAKSKAIGDKINIFAGDAFTFDADTPFHISHGFAEVKPKEHKFKEFGFDLFIDGVQQDYDHLKKTRIKVDKGVEFLLQWIYNFPDGLPAGDYVIRGEWRVTCHVAVDWGAIPGPCTDPSEWVIFHENETVGTFE